MSPRQFRCPRCRKWGPGPNRSPGFVSAVCLGCVPDPADLKALSDFGRGDRKPRAKRSRKKVSK